MLERHNSVVNEAVNIEQTIIPIRIQKTAKIRPGTEFGALSPYPTVVIDINDHQNPSNKPMRKGLGNSSAFTCVSMAHAIKPLIKPKSKQRVNEGHTRLQASVILSATYV